jgi:hypothetical protein
VITVEQIVLLKGLLIDMKTELMLTTRPIRHVFFISSHDLAQFLTVVARCCAQWGGINNLIIPVDTTDERSSAAQREQQLLTFVQQRRPDCFINALPREAQACSTWKQLTATIEHTFPGKPLLAWDVFCRESQEVHPASFVSPDEAFTYTFDTNHFLNPVRIPVPALPQFRWVQYGAAPSDIERAVITAAFGDIPSQDRALYPPLRDTPIIGQQGETILRDQMNKDPFGSIINLTLKELKCLITAGTVPSLAFDVVVAQDVSDLCLFWNLRAFSFGYHWLPDRRILLLTKEQLFIEQYHRPLFELIKKHRGTPPYLAAFIRQQSQIQDPQAMLILPDLDVVFHYQSDDEIRQFLQTQEGLHPCPGRAFLTVRDEQGREHREEIRSWEGAEAERPLFYAENRIEAVPSYYEYGGALTPFFTEVTEGANTLHVPSSQLNSRGSGQVRKDIVSSLWQSYLPHPSVATLVAPDGSFDTIAEDVEPVFSYPSTIGGQTASTQRISFSLPKTWEMYQAYFRSLGYEVGPSDKMTYATGLLNLAGGLEQAIIFRSLIAYQLLDALAMRAPQKLAREIVGLIPNEAHLPFTTEALREMIAASNLVPRFQRNPKSFGELKSLLSSTQKAECLGVLSKLVGIKAIQRGWTILCPHCRVSQWYGLGALNERMVCLGCLEPFDVPLRATEQADTDRSLQYALNPLTDRAMDQDILPVIIALLALRTLHQSMAQIVPGMPFQEIGSLDTRGDFDFLYVCQQHLYGGECKSGQILGLKDMRTAELARQLGFRAFFFATVSHFSSESQQLVSELQQSLRDSHDTDRPFDIFLLEEQQMFRGPLPEGIPVTLYKEIWSRAL